jgi:5-oxoprolinase (ATP-hydrolysing) subunit B
MKDEHPMAGQALRDISLLGSKALIFEPECPFDLASQRRIWAMAEAAGQWPGVREAVPGMTNLTLLFDTAPADIEALSGALRALWDSGIERQVPGRLLEVEIAYGGPGGPHLADVAAATGLSVAAVVEIHSAPVYTVFAVGSHAGYCYLGGLDPRLFVPRRKVPLVSLPGGSLSVAGMQTGVSASAGPSGWHTIGTADVAFFDPRRDPAALLRPGDQIRFVVGGLTE